MNVLFKGFDWKNGKFNEAQENYLKLFAKNQELIYLSGTTDEKIAEKHLFRVYKKVDKSKPKIIWYDSPEQMVKAVGASVGASVRASVRDSVGASVRASVRDSVGASVRASVRASVKSWDDSGWVSHYKFFSEEFESNALDDWCKYSEQVTGGLLADDTAHLVRKPKRIVRSPNGRLHYDHDKAIEWNNGDGFYYLNGVEFDKKTWTNIVEEKVTLKNLGDITNADQRAVAVQFLRPDRLLKQVNAKLIDTGEKGTQLYEVPNFMDTGDTEYCMKMEHPSIKNKFYIEWVEPKVGKQKDADLAQATAFRFTKEQYLMADEA